ncbi:NAD(P)-dependent oxidoreductase [Paenibacillus anaericanus]|uniref:NAD(P)-dependent oxidoreductase n=1 Tax=Paenibacillus anaericanus TaxID=170367 RepID=A0A3S1C4X3_9BACL|nr:NAD-dependent epimerase/dehydratase family protein [Paenibacillus anaericanus]RUT42881.1 NAD(P)-dependent oxidoreductase [Paenibacillus anaericanus]
MNNRCLVGYTGYVGTTLLTQTDFDDLYNSSNIESIQNKEYGLIVCAAAPAVKWKANQAPQEDLDNINRLITSLKKVRTERFILISTVDVYMNPIDVNEDSYIDPETAEPYGRHRYYLEQFVKENFTNYLIIRLPGLFGKGLKKNFIYDLIHSNAMHLTHHQSKFQFYNMSSLWNDIQTSLNNSVSLVNFATEPVSPFEVAKYSLGTTFLNETEKNPVFYNMRSKHANLFNLDGEDGYLKSKDVILQEITAFIEEEKRGC